MDIKKASITRRKFLQAAGLTTAGLTIAPFTVGSENRNSKINSSSKNNGEHILFSFDDHSIPWKQNLQLTMVKPDKYAKNPVVPRGKKGSVDEFGVQFYGSVLKHEDKFKMWYIAIDDESLELIKKGRGFVGLRVAYAESDDGINWYKPNLGLVEYRGDKNNNLVRIDPPNTGGIHLIVIHEPDDPNPDHRFKMMLTVLAELGGVVEKGSTSITLFSPDGIHWKSATDINFEDGFLNKSDLVLPPTNFEQAGLFKWDGVYHMAGQVFSPTVWQPDGKLVGRVMAILRSDDLLDWSPAMSYSFIRNGMSGKVIPVGQGEEAHLAASVWDRNNVLVGIYGLWHGAENWKDRSMDLGFLISNDGIHFREPISDYPFIKRGDKGEWDQGGLLQGQGFFNKGDKTFIYYGSWDLTKPSYPPRGGVGLVTLRKDGFGYLSPKDKEQPAHFITRRIKKQEVSSGKIKIVINAEEISRESPLRVEVLDETLMPIPEYAGENAALITEDGLDQEVVWSPRKGGKFLEINTDFSVKVTYPTNGNTKVYALYLSGNP